VRGQVYIVQYCTIARVTECHHNQRAHIIGLIIIDLQKRIYSSLILQTIHEGVPTAVKLGKEKSVAFPMRVGLHQGPVVSPLLFIIVLEALSTETGLPWELLYADDLILIAQSEDKLIDKPRVWKKGFEENGMKVNVEKTKVMICSDEFIVAKESGKFPCAIC
jgi:hypothetical protein